MLVRHVPSGFQSLELCRFVQIIFSVNNAAVNTLIRLSSALQVVTHTVEVESAESQKALAELQKKNAGLQEQLSVQRQLLRELETQLHESQRTCAQLRTQVTPVCLIVCLL